MQQVLDDSVASPRLTAWLLGLFAHNYRAHAARLEQRTAEFVAAALLVAGAAWFYRDYWYPQLVGGAGVYKANSAHGPFIHVDVRGRKVAAHATTRSSGSA